MDLCGRPTASGAPCQNWRTSAPTGNGWEAHTFAACIHHLTATERAQRDALIEADRQRNDAEAFNALAPACWSWPVTDEHRHRARVAADDEVAAYGLLLDWNGNRCAVCGDTDGLIEDHDHATGLIRGLLCRPCNTAEPHRGGPFRRYRERNPATILGVRVRYWHPVAREYAAPTPSVDRWRDNPMRGVGL